MIPGGTGPLKLLAIVVGVVAGGAIAMWLVSVLMLVLTVVGIASASASGLLLYAWIIAGYLIYRAIRSKASDERYYRYEDDDEREWREREYRRRAVRTVEVVEEARPDTRAKDERRRGIGSVVLAVLAGLALALGVNVGLGGLRLAPLANTLLPMLAGAGVGLGVYAALKRWVMPPIDEEKPPSRQVRAQIGRVRHKARDLAREAKAAGGVFSDLDYQAERLAREASELADRLYDLRRIARDARREMGNPARPDGIPHDATAPEVQSAVRRAQEAQQRLDDLLARNRNAQHQCLAQIERIEDMLDVARLEVACPDATPAPDHSPDRLVREVETELEAARRALAEVQRESQVL